MTIYEELLLFFDDYFKKLKVDYMLFASTLLGIVREGHLLDRDMEIDVLMLGEDINQKLIGEFGREGLIKSIFQKEMNNCKEKYGLIYLTPKEHRTQGWLAISTIWKRKGLCFTNLVNSDCMTLPRSTYDKKKWSTIEYLGRKFKAPYNPKRWLAAYYGKDWRIPRSDWHWKNNKNYKLWEELWP